MQKDNNAIERLVLIELLRLNGVILGIILGLLFGFGIFIATIILVLKGGEVVGREGVRVRAQADQWRQAKNGRCGNPCRRKVRIHRRSSVRSWNRGNSEPRSIVMAVPMTMSQVQPSGSFPALIRNKSTAQTRVLMSMAGTLARLALRRVSRPSEKPIPATPGK